MPYRLLFRFVDPEDPEDLKTWPTLAEVARELGVDWSYVYDLVRLGKLAVARTRIKGAYRLEPTEVCQFIQRRAERLARYKRRPGPHNRERHLPRLAAVTSPGNEGDHAEQLPNHDERRAG
jgi:hypothetical protein